ncbi:MAG: glutamine synthetase family protein [Rhodospirillales bacterium]
MNNIKDTLSAWCQEHRITEVECLLPDMAGIPRGKILPTGKFLNGLDDDGHKIPESVFIQTVTGDFPTSEIIDLKDLDVLLRPDVDTIRPVPWYEEPTAQIICDCVYRDGSGVDIFSRQVLRNVMDLYKERGWKPVIAPELEFYLVKTNKDPDYPLEPPVGRSGRPETGRQAYGIDAVNEFDPIFEDIYDYCEAQRIDINTLNHESGAAQFEINFRHGDPLDLADQVFLFKRTVRQTALRHNLYATFMAKPMQNEPGSAMHVHQSILDAGGRNIFSGEDGAASAAFHHFIGGLQKYGPAAMPLFAPNVNSYRRFTYNEAPLNVRWGVENRTCGLRVPESTPEARRVENRIIAADVNPYAGVAATMACGFLGLREQLEPTAPETTGDYGGSSGLPVHIDDALTLMETCEPLKDVLGARFVQAVCAVKRAEYDTYQRVISSWEREHLLLNV